MSRLLLPPPQPSPARGLQWGRERTTRECKSQNSKRTFTQPRNIRRPLARRGPAKAAIFFDNRNIVDAGFAPAHQAVFVEFPLFVTVGAMPLTGVVMPLLLKPPREAFAVERPEILDQAILMFPPPFAG